MIQTRTSNRPVELRENRRLSFYAALFDQPALIYDIGPDHKTRTRFTETVRPGAFTTALSSNREVLANIDHDDSRTFARRSTGELLLQEDGKGLFCTCWLPDSPLADQLITDIQAGRIDATSFRWTKNPTGEKWRTQGDQLFCDLTDIPLQDVTVTATPAYDTHGEVMLRTAEKYTELFRRLRLTKLKTRR